MSDELLEMMSPERIARMEWVLDRRIMGLTVLLEDVHKPQNMAACIRTIEAFGIQDVHLIENEAAFEPHHRVTRGCHKYMDLHRHDNAVGAVASLKDRGFKVLATSPTAERTLEDLDFSEPAVLCFGSERFGMTGELFGLADQTFRIPMFGFSESFNISVSVGICLHTAVAARRRALGAYSDLPLERRKTLRTTWIPRMRKRSERILRGLAYRDAGE